jgi:hypothetical protein
MNAEWHRLHPMPRNPSLAQRVAWHRDHQRRCACGPVPASVRPFLRPRGGKRYRVSG